MNSQECVENYTPSFNANTLSTSRLPLESMMIFPVAPINTRCPLSIKFTFGKSHTNLDILCKEIALQDLYKTHGDPAKHRTCNIQQRLSDQLP